MKKFKIPIGETHAFRKVNVVTEFDEISQYDTMKCSVCGIEGKCRDLQTVEISRMTKKAKYCNLSNTQIKRQESIAEYDSGTNASIQCPNCKKNLREIALYTEEGTSKIFAHNICTCGYKNLTDVTARESKNKKPISQNLLQKFQEQKKLHSK